MTNGEPCVTVKLRQKLKEGKPIVMKTVTQDMLYRQALINYAQKHGVTKAAIRYKTNRQYIYRWIKRYDGTLESLADKSHRPHHHPNAHTPEELKLIADMRRRNPNAGLVVFRVKLKLRRLSSKKSALKLLLSNLDETYKKHLRTFSEMRMSFFVRIQIKIILYYCRKFQKYMIKYFR